MKCSGDYENAQKHYERAYKSDPKESSLIFLYKSSQLLFELGEFQTSEDQIRVVASLSKRPEIKKRAVFHLARIMAATGREEDALKVAMLISSDSSYTMGNESVLFFIIAVSRSLGNKNEELLALDRLKKDYPGTIELKIAQASDIGSPILFPSPGIYLNPLPDRKKNEKTAVQPLNKSIESKPIIENPPKLKKNDNPQAESIQTGSFSIKENAEYMMKDLKKLGFDAAVREDLRPTGKKIYKVLIPLRPDQKTTEGVQKALLVLKEKGIEGFLLFQ